MAPRQLRLLLRELDASGDGMVSKSEFFEAIRMKECLAKAFILSSNGKSPGKLFSAVVSSASPFDIDLRGGSSFWNGRFWVS
jgi:hypothetical protein